jgi:uncharacterized protein YodC (DUF2158 family)
MSDIDEKFESALERFNRSQAQQSPKENPIPPHDPRPIKPFDVVRLKSGGPAMTVTGFGSEAKNADDNPALCVNAYCAYWNDGLVEVTIPLGALIHCA